MRMVFIPKLRRVVALTLAAGALAGCAQAGGSTGAGGLTVVTSFYPLQFVTERVAGDAATVANLTKAGAEPHDLELTPRAVAALADADLVVYLSGFQPAVDTAVAQQAGDTSYDVADRAALDLTYSRIAEGGADTDRAGAPDPHFWLDPIRLADVADAVAARLAELAPEAAAGFRRNAVTLRADLTTLDAELSAGLADCASTDLVTSHTAFGYLAARYGLDQRGITGLSAEDEPSPRELADVADFVATHRVRTIYHETLVSPVVAEALAREARARSAVLDPLEGLDASSAGSDYLEVMRANLASLREGQPCR